MPSLQTITDELLVRAIATAGQRVVLIAPGVWPPVAEAVAEAWRRLGANRVTAILDVNPEICRIGYGSLEGLNILQAAATQAGEAIGQEPGIRICVVIADQQTFIFSPTPRQLEAAPGDSTIQGSEQQPQGAELATAAQPSATPPSSSASIPSSVPPRLPPPPRPNGLVLTQPPAGLERELGTGPEGISSRSLGLEPLSSEQLQAVRQDLNSNPPKRFDLAQAVNVYNARIQFVELKVSGCRLSEHKARIPQDLVHVLRKNPKLSEKIENSIQLLDSRDELVTDPKLSQETIFKRREEIAEKFLRTVKGVGTVIERSKKAEFLKEVELIKSEVDRFAKQIEGKLAGRFSATAKDLAAELVDDILSDPPEKWRKKLGPIPDRERLQWLIREDLMKAFGTPEKKVQKMIVATVLKDVTYDMLKDPNFRAEINSHFPDLPLMTEYSAAKERPASDSHKP